MYIFETSPKVSLKRLALPGKHILFFLYTTTLAMFFPPTEHQAPSLKIHPFLPSEILPS